MRGTCAEAVTEEMELASGACRRAAPNTLSPSWRPMVTCKDRGEGSRARDEGQTASNAAQCHPGVLHSCPIRVGLRRQGQVGMVGWD